jgi:hypothetical protein
MNSSLRQLLILSLVYVLCICIENQAEAQTEAKQKIIHGRI